MILIIKYVYIGYWRLKNDKEISKFYEQRLIEMDKMMNTHQIQKNNNEDTDHKEIINKETISVNNETLDSINVCSTISIEINKKRQRIDIDETISIKTKKKKPSEVLDIKNLCSY